MTYDTFYSINYDNSNIYPYSGNQLDKWSIYKSTKGREIFVSDNNFNDDPNYVTGNIKEDIEKIGLIGELKTYLPLLPDEPIPELNLYKNRNVILIDETINNESILIKTHKLDYIFIDITNRKLQIRFNDDIEIETGHNLNLKVANDMNIEIGNNLNINIGNDKLANIGHNYTTNIVNDMNIEIGNDKLSNIGHDYTTNIDNDMWTTINRDIHVYIYRDSYYKFCGRSYSTRCDEPQLSLDPAVHPQGDRN